MWALNRQICNWSNGDCCFPYIKNFWPNSHGLQDPRFGEKCHFDWITRNWTYIQQNNRFKWINEGYQGTLVSGFLLTSLVHRSWIFAWHIADPFFFDLDGRSRVVEPKDVLRSQDVNHCEQEKVRHFPTLFLNCNFKLLSLLYSCLYFFTFARAYSIKYLKLVFLKYEPRIGSKGSDFWLFQCCFSKLF